MKKIRYCQRQPYYYCHVGWGSLNCKPDGTSEMKSCCDEPMEENCRMIVEDDRDEPMFGQHIKEAVRTLKDTYHQLKGR